MNSSLKEKNLKGSLKVTHTYKWVQTTLNFVDVWLFRPVTPDWAVPIPAVPCPPTPWCGWLSTTNCGHSLTDQSQSHCGKTEGQCRNTVAKEVPEVLTVHSRDGMKAQRDFSKSKPKAVKPRGPNPSGFSDKGLPSNVLNFYCEC